MKKTILIQNPTCCGHPHLHSPVLDPCPVRSFTVEIGHRITDNVKCPLCGYPDALLILDSSRNELDIFCGKCDYEYSMRCPKAVCKIE